MIAATCALCGGLRVSAVGALTPREYELLGLMARGYDNRAIADALTLQRKTVERHTANVYGKLTEVVDRPGAHRRVVAVLAYLRHNAQLECTHDG